MDTLDMVFQLVELLLWMWLRGVISPTIGFDITRNALGGHQPNL